MEILLGGFFEVFYFLCFIIQFYDMKFKTKKKNNKKL